MTIDFKNTIAARRRARDAQWRGMRDRHIGATLERRVESARRAARHAGHALRSSTGPQVPKP